MNEPASPSVASGPPAPARLFVGIPLDDVTRDALMRALPAEPVPGRRVPPEKWHLTLRFLGDTDADAERRVRDALRAAWLGDATDLRFDHLGAFPRPARASVLWVGVGDGADALRAIAARVEQAVCAAGCAPETRPFAAHLTLSRLQPPRDVHGLVDTVPALAVAMHVDAVVLLRSHLARGPSRYEAIERFPLTRP